MVDESLLLRAWQRGDLRAGDALFRRLFGPLRRFFANKVREPQHLEELLARTLELLVRRCKAFEGRSRFRTYALGIARNVLRDYYRGYVWDKRTVPLESRSIVEMGASPWSALAEGREHRLLLHALRRIPLAQQIVLELYYWEEMSASQTAAVLGVPEGTVRGRVRRAKQLLKAELAKLARSPKELETTVGNLDRWAAALREQMSG